MEVENLKKQLNVPVIFGNNSRFDFNAKKLMLLKIRLKKLGVSEEMYSECFHFCN
jgi:hypothetical protein